MKLNWRLRTYWKAEARILLVYIVLVSQFSKHLGGGIWGEIQTSGAVTTCGMLFFAVHKISGYFFVFKCKIKTNLLKQIYLTFYAEGSIIKTWRILMISSFKAKKGILRKWKSCCCWLDLNRSQESIFKERKIKRVVCLLFCSHLVTKKS